MGVFRQPAIINPNREWVIAELAKLRQEWALWAEDVARIVDRPFDPRTQSDVFADGEANMQRHEVLQAKTLTFLNNNIEGHGFIDGFDGTGCDRTDLRLKYRVKHRLSALEALQASLVYATSTTGSSPSASSGPATFPDRLRAFVAQHWRAVVKWVAGIIATVLAGYLLKHFAG